MTTSSPPLAYPQEVLALLAQGNASDAINFLHQALSVNPENAAALHLFGMLHVNAGRCDLAWPHLKKAAALVKEDAAISLHLAMAYDALGLDWEVIAVLEKLYRTEHPTLDIAIRYAQALNKVGEATEALSVLERTLSRFPRSAVCFAEINKLLRQIGRRSHAVHYANPRPILFVGQGHSAGSYIASELARRLEIWNDDKGLVEGYTHDAVIIAQRVERFLSKGGISHTHLFPRKESLIVLDCSGLDRLIVHVRDPRQAIVSMFYWLNELKARAHDPGISRFDYPLLLAGLPKGFFDWPEQERLEAYIELEMPRVVQWLEGWAQASEDKWRFQIKFTRFEDFKADINSFFVSIVDFLGIERQELKGEPYQSRPGENGRTGEHALRKSLIDEWRTVLSPSQKERVHQIIPRPLLERFGYDPNVR
jgi:tetratricopeptide (TPR) repeat protein